MDPQHPNSRGERGLGLIDEAVSGTEIAIVNGLTSGDRIITTGANLLKDGQRVEVLQ